MAKYLLDSNIVTCILRRKNKADFLIGQKVQNVLKADDRILICPIVFYEVARGLYHKNAQKQLVALAVLLKKSVWCEFDSETWDTAAQLWADCRKNGTPTGDGLDKDVLIAAQVREQNAILITNNIKHFEHFGITFENWSTQTS